VNQADKNLIERDIRLAIKSHEQSYHGETPKQKGFVPPLTDEVQEYAGSEFDAIAFVNHYTSNGWMIGKNKMKDWRAAVRTWKLRNKIYKTKLYPLPGKLCSVKTCKMPAVYKDTSGAYDSYLCAKHLPEQVKELYC
jgi:hypothetical protein